MADGDDGHIEGRRGQDADAEDGRQQQHCSDHSLRWGERVSNGKQSARRKTNASVVVVVVVVGISVIGGNV